MKGLIVERNPEARDGVVWSRAHCHILTHPLDNFYSVSCSPTSTMKVNVTQEEYEAFDRATTRGSIEGIAAGLAISLPASFAAQRYLPAYRALPIHLKALGVILIVGPTWAIQTERRGVEFDEQHNWWVRSVCRCVGPITDILVGKVSAVSY